MLACLLHSSKLTETIKFPVGRDASGLAVADVFVKDHAGEGMQELVLDCLVGRLRPVLRVEPRLAQPVPRLVIHLQLDILPVHL
jgi:hypothetical protein